MAARTTVTTATGLSKRFEARLKEIDLRCGDGPVRDLPPMCKTR